MCYSLPSCCIWTSSSNAFCHLCVNILLNNLHASCCFCILKYISTRLLTRDIWNPMPFDDVFMTLPGIFKCPYTGTRIQDLYKCDTAWLHTWLPHLSMEWRCFCHCPHLAPQVQWSWHSTRETTLHVGILL